MIEDAIEARNGFGIDSGAANIGVIKDSIDVEEDYLVHSQVSTMQGSSVSDR